MSVSADQFDIGVVFETFREFKLKFDEYSRTNWYVCHIEDSRRIKDPSLLESIVYERILLTCIHYGEPRIQAKKDVDKNKKCWFNSHSLKRNCTFFIRSNYSSKCKKLLIKDKCFNHNHQTSKQLYHLYPKNRQSTSDEYKELLSLVELGVRAKVVVDRFRLNTGLPLQMRDLHNAKARIKPKEKMLSTSQECCRGWHRDSTRIL
jgi:hypothetical protein